MSSSHYVINEPQAINLGVGGPQIYDSRAAVYEKQGMTKEALLEAKRVIDLYPNSWQVSSVLPSQAIEFDGMHVERDTDALLVSS
jgi:hypothetical protein